MAHLDEVIVQFVVVCYVVVETLNLKVLNAWIVL
jgi:hypothetical protein